MGASIKNIVALIIFMCAAGHLNADDKKKPKPNRKAWNPYACCHDINSITKTPVVITELYLVPEFYFPDEQQNGDTTLSFTCYDSRDSVMNMDTVADFNKVRYASLIKVYTDHEHTYKDDDGKRKPLPVTLIVGRYDRLGKEKWMNIAYPGNKYTELKEYRNEIVRTDSLMEEGATPNEIVLSVFRYYKVFPVKY